MPPDPGYGFSKPSNRSDPLFLHLENGDISNISSRVISENQQRRHRQLPSTLCFTAWQENILKY